MGLFRRKPREVGFVLTNAEELHAQYPETFEIPELEQREQLHPGELVKLVFELVNPTDGMPSAERMWVIVTDLCCGHYVGRLDNDPLHITSLSAGDRVDFGPEHVIDIWDDHEQDASA